MSEKKRLSVEEMLAAARASATSGATPADKPKAAAAEAAPAADVAPAAASKPAPAAAKSGERPDVSSILAAARSGAKGAAPTSAAAASSAPAKPAAKQVTVEPAAEVTKAGPRDTGSILASARAEKKPGPMSKAEAAAAGIEASPKPKAVAPPMPAKPVSALPKPAATTVDEDRRGVLGFLGGIAAAATNSMLGIGFTALSVTGGLWTLGTARFMFPNILTEPPSKFKVGFPADFPPGQVQTKFVSQYGVWVVNGEYNGARQIYALKTVCTHLGCTPNWLEGEQKFKCPCHGSGFYKDGINFEGPAPRPLERYAIRLADDGQIEIDKSKKFQEEMGQWVDSSCFVNA